MSKRQFIFLGIIIMMSVAFFITASIMKSAKYHFTVDEILNSEKLQEKVIQVDGFVKPDSIKWNTDGYLLIFQLSSKEISENPEVQLTEQKYSNFIKVFYKNGIVPNNFQHGKGVVVEGIYNNAQNIIYATKLMTKCPSKYESEEHFYDS